MTSQAAPQGGPRGRVTSWLVHRQFVLLAVAMPAYVVSDIMRNPAFRIVAVVTTTVVLFSLALQLRHDRGLCERCLSTMPLDGPAAAARKVHTLRAYHVLSTWPLGIVLLTSLVQVLANQRPVVAAAAAVGSTLLATQAWAAYVHRPLQPWCHDCGWGDDGDDDGEPVGDPLPVIESTKTRTG